jgi:GTP-binding protein HflX
MLVAAPNKDVPVALADEHLAELGRLTETAGGEVVGVLRQRLDHPHPRYYLGEGKAEELRDQVAATEAGLVIFDEELSPAQGKNLEELVGVRVLDRSELILDIFATRARSRESRMQVELAQLEYLLPRLKRMWSHLSRIRGGIGLRGPGETQLETDRRMIGEKIADLKRKLQDVARARAVQRGSRAGQFRAALVGYTNAGKSSLLKALSGDEELFVEDRLFATLDSATRSVDLGDGYAALVTDTVGFIRKLPHHLVASFRSTLEEAREADLLLHVVDASHPDWPEQFDVVEQVLEELELGERPQVLVFNKVDRLTHEEEEVLRDRVRAFEARPAVFVSALEPESLAAVRETLKARMRQRLPRVHMEISSGDGELLAMLYREGEVLERLDHETHIDVTARITDRLLRQLRQREGIRILEVA